MDHFLVHGPSCLDISSSVLKSYQPGPLWHVWPVFARLNLWARRLLASRKQVPVFLEEAAAHAAAQHPFLGYKLFSHCAAMRAAP
jgi:hypothetical protein